MANTMTAPTSTTTTTTITSSSSSSSSSNTTTSEAFSGMNQGKGPSSLLKFQHKGAEIDWNLPTFRKGFLGHVDSAIGPGATKEELGVTLFALFFSIGFMLTVIFPAHPEWSWAQKGWVIFFASNSGWGTLTATSAFKRWYHQGGSGIAGMDLLICFSDVATQFLLANWLFLDQLGGQWWYALEYDLFLFTAFSLFRLVPFYLRRPTNVAMLMVGALLSTYIFEKIPGLEWFPYLIFMKNLLHIVREEPYRPENEQQQQQQQQHRFPKEHHPHDQ